MSKHTPRPWKIVKSKFNGELRIEVTKACGSVYEIVREVGGEIRKGKDGKWSDRSEVKANARLIAAAPELLEALAYALPYLRATVPNPRNGVNPDCTPDVNCVDRAIAAIAKATGATP